MDFYSGLDNALHQLYSKTNVAGRLHYLIDEARVSAQKQRLQRSASLMPHSNRFAAVRAHMKKEINASTVKTLKAFRPAFSAIDLMCGKSFVERPMRARFPRSPYELSCGLGVLGYLSLVGVVVPAPITGTVYSAIRSTTSLAKPAAALCSGAELAQGIPVVKVLGHACELICWPTIRIVAQIPSLIGFGIKAIPLAMAALYGAAVGAWRGTTDELVEMQSPNRTHHGARTDTEPYASHANERAVNLSHSRLVSGSRPRPT